MYLESRLYRPPPRDAPWENALILEGNKIFTLTGLRAGTQYRLRWQAPDRQYPDVTVSTHGEKTKSCFSVEKNAATFFW